MKVATPIRAAGILIAFFMVGQARADLVTLTFESEVTGVFLFQGATDDLGFYAGEQITESVTFDSNSLTVLSATFGDFGNLPMFEGSQLTTYPDFFAATMRTAEPGGSPYDLIEADLYLANGTTIQNYQTEDWTSLSTSSFNLQESDISLLRIWFGGNDPRTDVDTQFGLESVQVTDVPTPEPSTFAIFVSAALGLGVRRGRGLMRRSSTE